MQRFHMRRTVPKASEERRASAAGSEPSQLFDWLNASDDETLAQLSMQELKQVMLAEAELQDQIVAKMCHTIEKTIAENDARLRGHTHKPATEFEAMCTRRFRISATDLVNRVLDCGMCTPCSAVVGLMFLGRLKRRAPGMRLTSESYGTLLLVSFMTASKVCDDGSLSNIKWAELGRLDVGLLNELELEFLFGVSFDLSVQITEYKDFIRLLLFGAKPPPHQQKRTQIRTELHNWWLRVSGGASPPRTQAPTEPSSPASRRPPSDDTPAPARQSSSPSAKQASSPMGAASARPAEPRDAAPRRPSGAFQSPKGELHMSDLPDSGLPMSDLSLLPPVAAELGCPALLPLRRPGSKPVLLRSKTTSTSGSMRLQRLLARAGGASYSASGASTASCGSPSAMVPPLCTRASPSCGKAGGGKGACGGATPPQHGADVCG